MYWAGISFNYAKSAQGLVGQKLAGRPVRLAFIPAVVVTHVYAYLADMAYGTKMNRIKAEAGTHARTQQYSFNVRRQTGSGRRDSGSTTRCSCPAR